jgi:hypothetical protein
MGLTSLLLFVGSECLLAVIIRLQCEMNDSVTYWVSLVVLHM